MKKYIVPITVLLVLSLAFLFKSRKNYFTVNGFAQGTTYNITYGTKNDLQLADSIKLILDRFDQSLSTYMDSSIISKINRNEDVKTDSLFNKVFRISQEVNGLSDGAFDITVAPLVNAWGFGWKESIDPDRMNIDSILEFVGMERVDLANNRIFKDDPRVQLDVNAVAQGYSVDLVAQFMDKWDIDNYLIDIGGEVRGKGLNHKGKYWRIGIEKPTEKNNGAERALQAVVELNNVSLATSGNYRKFFEKKGIKYVHTINPVTGEMVKSNLLSASVLTKECAMADALATTFMVLGLEKSKSLIKTLDNVEVFLIYADENGDYRTWSTRGFEKLVTIIE